jgi:hypothetical protein
LQQSIEKFKPKGIIDRAVATNKKRKVVAPGEKQVAL